MNKITERKENMDLPDIEISSVKPDNYEQLRNKQFDDLKNPDINDSEDLSKTFWKGRAVRQESKTDFFGHSRSYNPFADADKQNNDLVELHMSKELGMQSLEELDDYRNQQYMAMAGKYCPFITDKKGLEEDHFAKMNVIERNHRKHLINEYNARQKKIAELEALLTEMKSRQLPSEFAKTLPKILPREVHIYRGKDLQTYMNKSECVNLDNMTLEEIDSMDTMGPSIERNSYYTGTERDEIAGKYEADCQKRAQLLAARRAFDEAKRLHALKNDMDKLDYHTSDKVCTNYVSGHTSNNKKSDTDDIKTWTAEQIIAEQKKKKELANRPRYDPLRIESSNKARSEDEEIDKSLMEKFWARNEDSEALYMGDNTLPSPPSCNMKVVELVGSAWQYMTQLFSSPEKKTDVQKPTSYDNAKAVLPSKHTTPEEELRNFQLDALNPWYDDQDLPNVYDQDYDPMLRTKELHNLMREHMILKHMDTSHLDEVFKNAEKDIQSKIIDDQRKNLREHVEKEWKNQCENFEARIVGRQLFLENNRDAELSPIDKLHTQMKLSQLALEVKELLAKELADKNCITNPTADELPFQEFYNKKINKLYRSTDPLEPVYDEQPINNQLP